MPVHLQSFEHILYSVSLHVYCCVLSAFIKE